VVVVCAVGSVVVVVMLVVWARPSSASSGLPVEP
jgi:hypothetical protein